MENSFYYFFSATPQVLATILALFGFFLIFKIQALKDELIVKASDILEYVRICEQRDSGENEQLSKNIHEIFLLLVRWIQYKNIGTLHNIICIQAAELNKNDNTYKTYSDQYNSRFALHKSLIRTTKVFSVITILTIIGCLAVIPYSKYFLCKPDLLEGLFLITILCVSFCFVGLFAVLHLSLSNQSTLP